MLSVILAAVSLLIYLATLRLMAPAGKIGLDAWIWSQILHLVAWLVMAVALVVAAARSQAFVWLGPTGIRWVPLIVLHLVAGFVTYVCLWSRSAEIHRDIDWALVTMTGVVPVLLYGSGWLPALPGRLVLGAVALPVTGFGIMIWLGIVDINREVERESRLRALRERQELQERAFEKIDALAMSGPLDGYFPYVIDTSGDPVIREHVLQRILKHEAVSTRLAEALRADAEQRLAARLIVDDLRVPLNPELAAAAADCIRLEANALKYPNRHYEPEDRKDLVTEAAATLAERFSLVGYGPDLLPAVEQMIRVAGPPADLSETTRTGRGRLREWAQRQRQGIK